MKRQGIFLSVHFQPLKNWLSKIFIFLLLLPFLLPSVVNAQINSSYIQATDDAKLTTNQTIGVRYHTHIQNIGWQAEWAHDGSMSGTEGQGLRLEGIEIELTGDVPEGATIEYRTHIQNIGWEDFWSFNGSSSGSEGLGYRLEGIQIQLVDLPGYSVEYRTHVQNLGWESSWAKDGQVSGSQGQGLRLEGIEIRLVQNGPTVTTDLSNQSDISPTGGTVNLSDGAKLAVPSGAFTQSCNIELSRMVAQNTTESFYQLAGLPEDWTAPLEITLPLNAASTGDTYISVYYDSSNHPSSQETGYNRQLLKASVTNGLASVQLPSLHADATSNNSLSSQDVLQNYKIYVAVASQMSYEVAGWSTEYFGHFKLTVPTAVKNANPAIISEIKNALTESAAFIEDPAGANLSYAGGRDPFPVEIFDFSSLIEQYLGGRDANAWGYLEIPGYAKYSRSTALSNAWISINSATFNQANAAQQIRATIAHELFHYYEQLYLPNDANSQKFLQEASSVWVEFQMMKAYPNFWPAIIDPENVGWFPVNGLLRPSSTRCHNADAHAYAASLFLLYLTEDQGNQAIGRIWQSVRSNDEQFKAFADGFNDDPNWYSKWPDFVKKMFSGNYTQAMPDTTWSIHQSNSNMSTRYTVDNPYSDSSHQFTSSAYALSAQTHLIYLRYGNKNFNSGETADLKITNQSSADAIVYLYKEKSDGSVELLATIDSANPYILKDLAKIGKQNLSLVIASNWQPTAMGLNTSKNIVIDAEIVFDTQAPNDYDCGWQPDYSKLTKKPFGAGDYYKYGFSYYDANGRRHGLTRAYYDEALTKPLHATPFYEGKVHGIQTFWYENGNMEERFYYQQGNLQGSSQTWYENGQLAEECNFNNNLLDGSYKTWFNNGVPKSDGTYLNGKKEGTWTLWYGDGTKLAVHEYANDMYNGLGTTWHDNGVKASEGSYVNDHKTGTWTYWDRDGKVIE